MGEHRLDRHCYQIRLTAGTISLGRVAVSKREYPRTDYSYTYLKSNRLRVLSWQYIDDHNGHTESRRLIKNEERVIGIHTCRILMGVGLEARISQFLSSE